jgi:transcriptional regulator with XRE-family HTH domain
MEPSTLIRQARKSAGLTQAELARRAGMTQPEVARLEAAGANPRLATLKRVVAATGHSLALGLDEDAGIDETLIAGSLKETPAQRLRALQALYRTGQELGGRALRARGS